MVVLNVWESACGPCRAEAHRLPADLRPVGQQLLNFAGSVPLGSIPATLVIDNRGRITARIIGTITAHTLTQLITEVHTGR